MRFEFQFPEEFLGFTYRHFDYLIDRFLGQGDRQCFRSQSFSLALLTLLFNHVLFYLFSGVFGIRLMVSPFQIGNHSFKNRVCLRRRRRRRNDFLRPAVAVKNQIDYFVGQILHRFLQGEFVFFRQFLKLPPKISLSSNLVRGMRPGENRSFGNGQILIGNDQFRIHFQLLTQTLTAWTGAERRIERKQPRLHLGQGYAAFLAGEMLGKNQFARFLVFRLLFYCHYSLSQL